MCKIRIYQLNNIKQGIQEQHVKIKKNYMLKSKNVLESTK